MSNSNLTDTQTTTLIAAANRPDGNIEPLPGTIKGGARQKVIQGLVSRKLTEWQNNAWVLTDAGYAAVGRTRQRAAPKSAPDAQDAPSAPTVAKDAKPRRSREGSKQATVIQMLQRPEGATVQQICETTGWQAHTVRGTFAGAFKKLGLSIVSDKTQGGARIYRIA